ncbi:MAG: hypothetical protein V4563_17670 [Pseudomonadota bacterium]
MAVTTAAVIGAAAAVGGALADNKNAKASIKSQENQKAASQKFIEDQVKQARADIFKLYPDAQKSRQQGLSASLNLTQQAFPQMLNTFQQGNVAAQNQLIQGLPQMNNAILGGPLQQQPFTASTIQQPGLQIPQQPEFQQINQLGLGSG